MTLAVCAGSRPQTRYDEAMRGPDSGDLPDDSLGDMLRHGGSRVAFFGGSFDPPHLGHLAVARAARAAFRLDMVLFAPVGAQPLKPEGSAASFEDRLAMTRLAVDGEPGFTVSLADAPKASGDRRFQPNYTFETLENLRARLGPNCALYCLMGADSFFGLRHWHRAAEIAPCGAAASGCAARATAGWSAGCTAAGVDAGIRAGWGQVRIRGRGENLFAGQSRRRPSALLRLAGVGCADQRVGDPKSDSEGSSGRVRRRAVGRGGGAEVGTRFGS